MSIARQILFHIIPVFFCAICLAQRERIDSLKNVLPFLKDSARINCLNELSEAYHEIQTDTARIYAKQALKEAEKINYIAGLAEAYRNFGRVEAHLSTDLPSMENYFGKSLELYVKTGDDHEIAWAWGAVGYAKWVLCKFPDAMEAYEKAEQLLKKTGDTNLLAIHYEQAGLAALEWGNYEKALQYALKFEELTGVEHTFILGDLYKILGDYETALEYHRKAPAEGKGWQWKYLSLGATFFHKKQYDSANHYYQLFADYARADGGGQLGKFDASLGQLHLALKQYDSALFYLNAALNSHKKATDKNQVMLVLLILSKTYKEKGDYTKAMQTVQELLQIANETGARQYSRDAHFLLYELFENLQKQDKAYSHLRQYTILKDTIDLDFSAQKLAFYKTKSEREQAQSRINTLNDEKKLQYQKLQQAALQKKVFIAGILAIVLIAAILLRNLVLKRKNEKLRLEHELELQQLESEKTKTELQHKATELEMQALRSQMNPHFIFNCLSSINRFILKNESETASDYITKFSRLIRMVLNNSKEPLVSLEEELEMLRLYLDLERLRFKNSFDFTISFPDDFDASAINIPPLLLQPFAENAIWHGLMHKNGQGLLEIAFEPEDNVLNCYITDNGVGREKAEALKSKSAEKQKSMGIQITAGRLALLNKDAEQTVFNVEDLVDANGQAAGTRVTLKIKYKESIEEYF